ncbi:MAG: hypothetical protein R6X02_20070 [Enhygromyxa sp.]
MQTIDMHLLQELVRLHRLGLSRRAVAQRLEISRNIERKYRTPLTAAGLLKGDLNALPERAELKAVVVADLGEATPATRPSSIEDWAETIETMR